jgi:hypothetical protein
VVAVWSGVCRSMLGSCCLGSGRSL